LIHLKNNPTDGALGRTLDGKDQALLRGGEVPPRLYISEQSPGQGEGAISCRQPAYRVPRRQVEQAQGVCDPKGL